MQHLDEGTIHAWLDGELPPEEREALEAHLAGCEPCARAVAEARGFVAASSRIMMALDAVPGGVLPASSQISHVRAKAPRFTISSGWMAVAALLVLSTVSVIATRSGSDAPLAKLGEASATRSDVPAVATAPAPAVTGPAESQAASPAVNAHPPAAGERKEARAKPTRSLPAAPTLPAAHAPPAPAVRMDAKVQRDSSPVTALAAQAPKSAVADSARQRPALMLNEVVVTGAGTTSAAEKLGAVVASNEAPQLVSRGTSVEAGDTVVTTVYAVRGGTVTLIDRSAARDASLRASSPSFSDQVMAKARESTSVNSITWSDSSGRTRTLRGAMPRQELERIRAALFGPIR